MACRGVHTATGRRPGHAPLVLETAMSRATTGWAIFSVGQEGKMNKNRRNTLGRFCFGPSEKCKENAGPFRL